MVRSVEEEEWRQTPPNAMYYDQAYQLCRGGRGKVSRVVRHRYRLRLGIDGTIVASNRDTRCTITYRPDGRWTIDTRCDWSVYTARFLFRCTPELGKRGGRFSAWSGWRIAPGVPVEEESVVRIDRAVVHGRGPATKHRHMLRAYKLSRIAAKLADKAGGQQPEEANDNVV